MAAKRAGLTQALGLNTHMTTDRSDKVFEAARDAQLKFDYFILGLIGAIFAFIGQSFESDRIGLNPSTLELVSLLMLLVAAVCGFKRIESMNLTMRLNALNLRMQEERGMLSEGIGRSGINRATGEHISAEQISAKLEALNEVIPTSDEQIRKAQSTTLRNYKLRNRFLLAGFVTLLAARVFAAYV